MEELFNSANNIQRCYAQLESQLGIANKSPETKAKIKFILIEQMKLTYQKFSKMQNQMSSNDFIDRLNKKSVEYAFERILELHKRRQYADSNHSENRSNNNSNKRDKNSQFAKRSNETSNGMLVTTSSGIAGYADPLTNMNCNDKGTYFYNASGQIVKNIPDTNENMFGDKDLNDEYEYRMRAYKNQDPIPTTMPTQLIPSNNSNVKKMGSLQSQREDSFIDKLKNISPDKRKHILDILEGQNTNSNQDNKVSRSEKWTQEDISSQMSGAKPKVLEFDQTAILGTNTIQISNHTQGHTQSLENNYESQDANSTLLPQQIQPPEIEEDYSKVLERKLRERETFDIHHFDKNTLANTTTTTTTNSPSRSFQVRELTPTLPPAFTTPISELSTSPQSNNINEVTLGTYLKTLNLNPNKNEADSHIKRNSQTSNSNIHAKDTKINSNKKKEKKHTKKSDKNSNKKNKTNVNDLGISLEELQLLLQIVAMNVEADDDDDENEHSSKKNTKSKNKNTKNKNKNKKKTKEKEKEKEKDKEKKKDKLKIKHKKTNNSDKENTKKKNEKTEIPKQLSLQTITIKDQEITANLSQQQELPQQQIEQQQELRQQESQQEFEQVNILNKAIIGPISTTISETDNTNINVYEMNKKEIHDELFQDAVDIIINSEHYAMPNHYNDYLAVLSEPINNINKIEITKLNLPINKNNIDSHNNNLKLTSSDVQYKIQVPNGLYDVDSLIDKINELLTNQGTKSEVIKTTEGYIMIKSEIMFELNSNETGSILRTLGFTRSCYKNRNNYLSNKKCKLSTSNIAYLYFPDIFFKENIATIDMTSGSFIQHKKLVNLDSLDCIHIRFKANVSFEDEALYDFKNLPHSIELKVFTNQN